VSIDGVEVGVLNQGISANLKAIKFLLSVRLGVIGEPTVEFPNLIQRLHVMASPVSSSSVADLVGPMPEEEGRGDLLPDSLGGLRSAKCEQLDAPPSGKEARQADKATQTGSIAIGEVGCQTEAEWTPANHAKSWVSDHFLQPVIHLLICVFLFAEALSHWVEADEVFLASS